MTWRWEGERCRKVESLHCPSAERTLGDKIDNYTPENNRLLGKRAETDCAAAGGMGKIDGIEHSDSPDRAKSLASAIETRGIPLALS